MKIELKRISYSSRLSQETNAFAADVWINGKMAGTAENDGHGGDTNVNLYHLTPTEKAEVEEWVKLQPPIVFPPNEYSKGFIIPYDIEHSVDGLLEKHIIEKQEKKLISKGVVFRLKGDSEGSYLTMKFNPKNPSYNQKYKDFLATKYGDKIELILNEKYAKS